MVKKKVTKRVVRLDGFRFRGDGGWVRAHLLAAVAVVHAEEGGVLVES